MTGTAGAAQVLSVRRGPPLELQIAVPAELCWFEGHFPGCPVLPGVVQLDWAVRLGHQYLGTALDVLRIRDLKFTRIVQPGAPLTLILTRTDEGLSFQFRRGASTCSSGRVACAR